MNFFKTTLLTLLLLVASIANAGIIFSDDFSDNSENWSLGTTWEIGSATSSTGQSTYNADPSLDHTSDTNNGVAGVIIGGNAPTNLHDFYYLTSRAIDTSLYGSDLNFEFYRWLNSDYTSYMQNSVDVFDGTTWVNLWLSGASPGIQDSSWTLQSFDISSYANNNLKVRMGYMIGNSGAWSMSSWNVDDVKISSSIDVPEPSTLAIFALGIIGLASRRFKKQS